MKFNPRVRGLKNNRAPIKQLSRTDFDISKTLVFSPFPSSDDRIPILLSPPLSLTDLQTYPETQRTQKTEKEKRKMVQILNAGPIDVHVIINHSIILRGQHQILRPTCCCKSSVVPSVLRQIQHHKIKAHPHHTTFTPQHKKPNHRIKSRAYLETETESRPRKKMGIYYYYFFVL